MIRFSPPYIDDDIIKDYPSAYDLYSNEISLPIYPQLTADQCKTVTEAVIESVKELRPIKNLLYSLLFPVMILMGSFDSTMLSEEVDKEETYTWSEGFEKRKTGRYHRLAG